MAVREDVLERAIDTLRSDPSAEEKAQLLLARLEAVRTNLCADPQCHQRCQVSCGKPLAA
ncbi:MAG TPA: hypothetical protein VD995_18465 [Azospirillum sp.]|nr:hypothetical protein [Azospirillum sp.]